jgi:hypothetical protein
MALIKPPSPRTRASSDLPRFFAFGDSENTRKVEKTHRKTEMIKYSN